ncbi:MAG: glycosyltransferase family 39 protein [Myxococcota bacterium]
MRRRGWNRTQLWHLGLVVGLALVVRGRWGLADLIHNDGPEFVRMAEALGRGDLGEALSHPFHPLTSALMALLHSAVGLSLEGAGRLVSVLSGGLGAGALYLVARAGMPPPTALVAGLLFAVHPRLVDVSTSVQSDALHLALVLVASLLAWRGLQGHRTGAVLGSGLVCGLAYLTRPEGLLVAMVFGLALCAVALARRISAGAGLQLAGAFGLGLLLVGGPYVLTIHSITGEWRVSQKKSVVGILGIDPGPATPPVSPTLELLQDTPLPPSAPPPLVTALQEVLYDGLRAMRPAFLLLLMLGFRWSRPAPHTLYLLGYVAALGLLLLGLRLDAGYISRRHWLVGVAMLLPFVGRGFLETWIAILRRFASASVQPRLTGAGVAAVILGVGLFGLSAEEPVKRARRDAAVWLRTQGEAGFVAAPRSRVAYYAGAQRYIDMPETLDVTAFVDALRGSGASFLITEQSRVPAPLRAGGPGLVPVHRSPYPEGSVVVYRVEPEGS